MKIVKISLSVIAVLFIFLLTGRAVNAQSIYTSKQSGIDVSWPNCAAKPVTNASFGIVGVTYGKSFTANPCLNSEARWFNSFSLYANTGYPGSNYAEKYKNYPNICSSNDLRCLAYNYGFNAGRYASDKALTSGVLSSTWWLDVEKVNSWTSDYKQNRKALRGMSDAKKLSGVRIVGYYSTPTQCNDLTNNWKNRQPNWVATGSVLAAAKGYCTGYNFTGGETWLTQYLSNLDQDYAC